MHSVLLHRVSDISTRETIHDLRNLFGVVASARHMLDDGPTGERRTLLLDAIEDAAMRGGRLTSAMLGQGRAGRAGACFDLNEHLSGLGSLMQARAGRQVEIRFEPAAGPLPVKLDPADLDSAILELVSNACAAFVKPGVIRIRTRRLGGRVRLTVADNGCGMSAAMLHRALHRVEQPSVNGTGLGRVRHFAENAHGRLRFRSRENRGTIASLNLPLVLKVAGAETTATAPARWNRKTPKEIRHEKRQSITA
jgi:signal transduction histidine kinase